MTGAEAPPAIRAIDPRARRSAQVRFLPGVLLALGLGVAASVSAADPAEALTLDEALRLAEARSQALLAEESAAESSGALAVAAKQLPDPILGLSLDDVPATGPNRLSLSDDFMTMRSVSLGQTYVRSATRRARSARFEREAESARAMRAARLGELRRRTAQAWFDVYYAGRMLELVTRQRDESALQVDAAEAAYRSGSGAQGDAIAARAGVVRLEDRIDGARERVRTARSALERWVGDAASTPPADRPAIDATRLDLAALRRRPDDDPEVAYLSSRQDVARAAAEVARQERHPDWSVSLMYSDRGDAFSDMVSLGVSVPLPWNRKSLQDQELAARRAQAEELGYRRDELARERRADVDGLLHAWRSGLERMERYDDALIELAEERTQAALAAYRGGEQPLAAVLDARMLEIDVRIERLAVEADTAAAWAALEYLYVSPADAPEAS